jgi:YcaO-like protein with predicted kinase domain
MSGVQVLDRGRKVCFAGTHRVRTPEQTLAHIEPLFGRLGITRLADVTWLDDIGIPVYQAIRPNGYTLSVSQGKGLSPALAKVSAAMEAIESWHAERVPPGPTVATVGDVEPGLGYDLRELVLAPRHHLNPALRLEWSVARHLAGGGDTLVPTAYVRLDGRVFDRWQPPLCQLTSNGLASGNTTEEAVLHGLYEVIERDALVRYANASTPCPVDIRTVDGVAGQLIARFADADVEVRVEVMASPLGLPCFQAAIISDTFPVVFWGLGAHLDRDVSLCRALTEAAQSRLTSISGVRDDMTADSYWRARGVTTGRRDAPDLGTTTSGEPAISFQDTESVRNSDLADDLRLVVDRVAEYTGRDPLMVDHTRPEIGVPVVHVICPRLLHDTELL